MLNVILVALMAVCFLAGLVVLFFPFGKESVKAVKTAPATKSQAQISLEGIRAEARLAKVEDIQIFVVWFQGFHGYNREIPSSVRYQHMLEWREITDKLYKELPVELAQPWASIVHPR
jgi:hypothetical protein